MILAGGGVFVLAMAMNASTVWNVQNNIRELTEIRKDIRGLAAHSDQLARIIDDHTRLREESRPGIPESPSGVATLTRAVKIESSQPDLVSQPAIRLAYGKWGPPLVANFPKATRISTTWNAIVNGEQVHNDLLALGFDVSEDQAEQLTGLHTLQALDEFRALYLPGSLRQKKPDNERIAANIRKYAALARKDALKFRVRSGILAAIRLGSQRTGVEFSFLMELAAAESSFDPTSIAPTTAAAGLYQFKDDTWLEAIRDYGNKYGMHVYASQVESYTDAGGKRRLRIHDPAVQKYVLALRHNPRISALLAAEYVKLNRKQLSAVLDHEPGHTEMYLTHFLGATGAISFLRALSDDPDRIAGELFPSAAMHNQSLFHPRRSKPRTIADIYKLFERKFSRSRFLDTNPS